MHKIIILISSDPPIVNAAIKQFSPQGRITVAVYGYRIIQGHEWVCWNGSDFIPIHTLQIPDINCTLTLSGHGNSDGIGHSGPGRDIGPDLYPANLSHLLRNIHFKGNKLILSVCGTTALYSSFANKLAKCIEDNYFNARSRIYYPTKSLDADRNPLSEIDMDSIDL